MTHPPDETWWHLYLEGGDFYGGMTRSLDDALCLQQFYEYESDQAPAWLVASPQ